MARFEAAQAISNLSDSKNTMIIKVPVNKLQKDESDEVWYNNKLYDVVRREEMEDTLFVFLLRDEEEQGFLDLGSNYFQNDENTLQHKNQNSISLKKLSFKTDYNYIANLSEKISGNHFIQLPPTVKNNSYHNSACTDVPSPPPKAILLSWV